MSDKIRKFVVGDSASVPRMQFITEPLRAKKSATVPAMQPAPSKKSTHQQTTQNAGGNNSDHQKQK